MRCVSRPAARVRRSAYLLAFLLGPLVPGHAAAQTVSAPDGRQVTLTDLMQVMQVSSPSISDDGRWVALAAAPDRGDGRVIVRSAADATRWVIELADRPTISDDGRWVAARTVASLEESETMGRDAPRSGLALLRLADGEVERIDDVGSFAFAPGGGWVVYQLRAPRGGGAASSGDSAGDAGADAEGEGRPVGDPGTVLVLRDLASGAETRIEDVRDWTLHPDGGAIAWTVAGDGPDADALRIRDLSAGASAVDVHAGSLLQYASLAWREGSDELAFFVAPDGDGIREGTIHRWDGDALHTVVDAGDVPDGWLLPSNTRLEWSEDGERLFFGWRPWRPDEVAAREAEAEASDDTAFDPYDLGAILEDRGVDVWHVDDPMINPQQKVTWNRTKDRTFSAVWHRNGDRVVALGGPDLPNVSTPENGIRALATSDVPYQVSATWTGGRQDLYAVDLGSGARTRIAEELENGGDLSPGGRFVVWWNEGAYHLWDAESGATRNLTAGMGVPMADEDHDFPNAPPGYGVAGWLEDDAAVLLYDKYDLWVVPTDGSAPWSPTDGRGRAEHRIFRIQNVDDHEGAWAPDAELVLSMYHDLRKNFGFYRASLDARGVTPLLEEDRRFRFVASAEDADRVLFTREAYDEFPDLWVADRAFAGARKVTDVNPGLTSEFAWGDARLVEWESMDGTPMQGVAILPDDYEEGRRYPVLVYYYRFMSQRLYEFNDPSVNHRPSFPVYASDGYVVFLPDVRFEVGRPGLSSTKSVVPGVQKLVDLGIADADRVALHGHSWSGYQTAFMVTQTDMFRTAIAGAPVSNMTSAYTGIRLGSGLARMFQYETSQSRLSGSLWEARDEYIDNSPTFFADRIHTPMLILHGNEDDAVPWEQSIELYLALRRLGKEAVFLEYRGEPHHPQQYANKLDWAMKMKEWIDHFLKDAPAPAWITDGVPYTGN